jgi:hypothetical protein
VILIDCAEAINKEPLNQWHMNGNYFAVLCHYEKTTSISFFFIYIRALFGFTFFLNHEPKLGNRGDNIKKFLFEINIKCNVVNVMKIIYQFVFLMEVPLI